MMKRYDHLPLTPQLREKGKWVKYEAAAKRIADLTIACGTANRRIAELEQKLTEAQKDAERYRAALQDIADDPTIDRHTDMRRGVYGILAVARTAIAARGEE